MDNLRTGGEDWTRKESLKTANSAREISSHKKGKSRKKGLKKAPDAKMHSSNRSIRKEYD